MWYPDGLSGQVFPNFPKSGQMSEAHRPEEKRHLLARPGVYNLGIWGAGYIPRALSYGVAGTIARLSYRFYGAAGENLKRNLRRALPGADEARIALLARNTFRNYSKYLVDYARFKTIGKEALLRELASVEGTGHIEGCLSGGKGIILLTAHLGNWELGGIFFGKSGIKINVLTAHDNVQEITWIKERYRKYHNIDTIVLGDTPFSGLDALNALMRNEVVAMLVDRPAPGGIPATLFGAPTSFPPGPLLLARSAGSPIVPAFVVRDGSGYRAIAERPIYFDRDKDTPEAVASRVIAVFERYIRTYPDQWYNFVEV